MGHLSLEQKNTLHQALLQNKEELDKLLADSLHFGMAESLAERTGELSAYDNHPADIASELFEREKDLALSYHARNERGNVDAALKRINDDNYGVCAYCGEPIPYERLQAVPETEYCIKHTPIQTVSENRPIEESFLMPPFGRNDFDKRYNETEFDSEDAWQAVSQWGTSDSPAMTEDPGLDYDSLTIESDENVGYVEDLESFLATDLYGTDTFIVRNHAYYSYLDRQDGDPLLVPVTDSDENDNE
ncbi:MAG: TraR/DksA C4-type zinc finger protein [Gorillibacterium sp.]|nr:TraR/DksA C4-type zinc finger protein [Gorillibacterium sp.]